MYVIDLVVSTHFIAENNGTDFDLDLKVTSPHVAVNWSTVTQNFECFKNTSVLDNVPVS